MVPPESSIRASFGRDVLPGKDPSGLHRLDQLYAYYDGLAAEFQVVCAEGCAVCCTRSVWMTRLEASWLLARLGPDRMREACRRLDEARGQPHPVPKQSVITSLLSDDPEQEEGEGAGIPSGACPLLDGDRCSIYDARPFACRCMSSRTHCASSGFADQPERLLWLNVLFMQAIEHLDRNGFTGNLIDVVPFVEGRRGRVAERFAPNTGLKGWVLPPSYRVSMKSVADRLWAIIS